MFPYQNILLLALKDNIYNLVEIIKFLIHSIKVNPIILLPIVLYKNPKKILALFHKAIPSLIRIEGLIKNPNIIPKKNSPPISHLPSDPFIDNFLIFLCMFPNH